MFLAGLWCSTFKPAAFSFLEPIFKRLKTLEEEGTCVYFVYYQRLVDSKRRRGHVTRHLAKFISRLKIVKSSVCIVQSRQQSLL